MADLKWAPWFNAADFRIVRGSTKVHATKQGWLTTWCNWPYAWKTTSEQGALGNVTCKRCLDAMRRTGYVVETVEKS